VRLSKILTTLTAFAAFSMVTAEMAAAQSAQPAPRQFGPRKGAAGQAGQPQGQAPETETVAKHGKWDVQCVMLPNGKGQTEKNCGMIQITRSAKDERMIMSVIVSRSKGEGGTQTLMRLLAPVGVYLPTGVAIEIDGAALPNRLPFVRCNPRTCEAFGEASGDTLKRFNKGTTATFFVYDRPGNGYPLKVSLEGFAKAVAALDKL
jgi:invasion protein IalB